MPKTGAYVFTNSRTRERYTPNGVRHTFRRAVRRAKLVNPEQITPHTLRHTALSRMIAERHSDHTVMAISGHRSTRMLQRYIHRAEARGPRNRLVLGHKPVTKRNRAGQE